MLPQINIWLDVIGWVAIAGALAVFLGVHFPANVIAGRVKERFVDKHWWYLEAMHEPLPDEYVNVVYQRTWHWINFVSFMIFFASGIYIRYPYFEGGRLLMRNLHLAAAYINIVNYLYRMYWTLTGPDRKNFKFDKSDIKTFIENTKYYIFFAKSYPHEKKFHPMQRMTYITFAGLFPIQIITGAAMLWPSAVLGWISGPFGGIAAATAWMRIVHSAVFRIYLLVVVVHAYMAFMETWPTFKYFWFGIQSPELIKAGEVIAQRHGHEHESGHGKHEVEPEITEPEPEITEPEPEIIPVRTEKEEIAEPVGTEMTQADDDDGLASIGRHEEEN